jgi:nitrogen regulatory protein PII
MENNIKRIEITVESLYQQKIVDAIENAGAPGYTVLKEVEGKGRHGKKDGKGISDGYKNCMVIVYVNQEEIKGMIDQVKPLIVKFGGICVISDAHWVIQN